ncbi:MAG TPA: hypothetical protein VMY43_05275 [Methanothrix sp.]|jgi:hypothetical protein|nr:hypothetical protein [Methanothrix sp.]
MFYLGEYEEETAKEIKSYLDKAGLKVESKPCLVMEEDATYTLKDRLSGIKELIKDTSQIERYLSALRSVLPQATPENFEDLFLKELDPLMMEKRDRILALSENPESLSPEEMESLKFGSEEWKDNALSTSRARIFANMVLFANDVKIGEPFENKLDDPVLEIMVEPEDYDPRPKQLKCDIDFYLEKAITIFVDEFTTPLASEIDDEFWDAYPSEAQRLKAMGLLIEKLATSPSSRKMDFAQFTEECTLHLEDEERTLNVYGDDAAEELARVLEKSGVLKRKGEKIKWRKKD